MAKDIKGEINLGLGELLGEANVVRAESSDPAPTDAQTSVDMPPNSSKVAENPEANSDEIPVEPQGLNPPSVLVQKRQPRRRFGVGLGVIIGTLFAAWILSGPGLDADGGEMAIPEGSQRIPSLLAPVAQPLDTGALGGLIADLDRAGPRVTQAIVPNPPAPNQPNQAIPVAVPVSTRPQIDLKGPVEPLTVKEARETYRRNGGSEYANGQQEGASPFGPEKLPPFGGRRGKVIQGGETFRILRHTVVLSEPDDRGAEVAELFTGDRILAEEKVGQWLKIRSQKGREGYVPMRAAEPLSEYYQRVPWEAPNGSLDR